MFISENQKQKICFARILVHHLPITNNVLSMQKKKKLDDIENYKQKENALVSLNTAINFISANLSNMLLVANETDP